MEQRGVETVATTRAEILEGYGTKLREIELEHDLAWYKAQHMSNERRIEAEDEALEARETAERRAANELVDDIAKSYLEEI
jgi:hypothetical protein